MATNNYKNIPTIAQGAIIRAAYLSDMARAINLVSTALADNGVFPLSDGEVVTPDEDEVETLQGDDGPTAEPQNIWVEYSRAEDEVRVKNPDDEEQYVDVGRIRIVRFRNLLGAESFHVYAAE